MIREISNFEFQISNQHSPRRRGFTLVEVLVVIAIIGMLAAFLLPAIASAKRAARVATIKMEMAQLATAIENVRTTLGVSQYPPDGTNSADTKAFLRAAFPRCPAANYPTQIVSPSSATPFNPTTALCFWLGGNQDGNGQFIGFSSNPLNPFDTGPGRIGPFFDFGKTTDATRFMKNGSAAGGGAQGPWGLWEYFPNNGQIPGAAAPYVYLKAVAGTYTTNVVNITASAGGATIGTTWPYMDSNASGSYMNPKSYQLLCPGLDGKYGTYTTAPSYPNGPFDNVNGTDDMTNFTQSGTIGDDAK